MLLLVFLMKLADCSLATIKTVLLVKNKFFWSSIASSLSAALFIFVADIMANAPTNDKMLIAATIFLANFIGGYAPPKLIDKLEDDRLYIYNITSKDIKEVRQLADDLRLHNVPVSTYSSYMKIDEKIQETLTCKAFAFSKQDSKIINTYLDMGNFKSHRIIAI